MVSQCTPVRCLSWTNFFEIHGNRHDPGNKCFVPGYTKYVIVEHRTDVLWSEPLYDLSMRSRLRQIFNYKKLRAAPTCTLHIQMARPLSCTLFDNKPPSLMSIHMYMTLRRTNVLMGEQETSLIWCGSTWAITRIKAIGTRCTISGDEPWYAQRYSLTST